jgi:hypothetical protein
MITIPHDWHELGVLLQAGAQKLVMQDSKQAALVVAGALAAWWKETRGPMRRKRALEESGLRSAFWTSWRKSIAEVRPLKVEEQAMVEEELGRAASVVLEQFRFWPQPEIYTREEFQAFLQRKGVGWWFRRLLLLYPQPTKPAREGQRLTWYFTLGPLGLAALGIVVNIIKFFPDLSHVRTGQSSPITAELWVFAAVFRWGVRYRTKRWLDGMEDHQGNKIPATQGNKIPNASQS